jgi:hypothetical protein
LIRKTHARRKIFHRAWGDLTAFFWCERPSVAVFFDDRVGMGF